jgi:hypothetical protein
VSVGISAWIPILVSLSMSHVSSVIACIVLSGLRVEDKSP